MLLLKVKCFKDNLLIPNEHLACFKVFSAHMTEAMFKYSVDSLINVILQGLSCSKNCKVYSLTELASQKI